MHLGSAFAIHIVAQAKLYLIQRFIALKLVHGQGGQIWIQAISG